MQYVTCNQETAEKFVCGINRDYVAQEYMDAIIFRDARGNNLAYYYPDDSELGIPDQYA